MQKHSGPTIQTFKMLTLCYISSDFNKTVTAEGPSSLCYIMGPKRCGTQGLQWCFYNKCVFHKPA